MVDVIPAIQTAIEIVGKLRALSKKIEDAEFKMLLADLSGELADAKLEVANLKMELSKLIEQNAELNSRLLQRESDKPMFVDGAYTFKNDDGQYCTACYDTQHLRVRLSKLKPPFNDIGTWQCPSCSAVLD